MGSVQFVTLRHDQQPRTICDFGMTPITSSSLVPTSSSNESHTRSDELRARSKFTTHESHSCERASRSLQIRNSRSRSTEDRQPPCSTSTTTRSRGNSTALCYHVCRVSALCPARNFPSRSNQTMGCARAWMSGRAYESSLSMSRLVYKLKTNVDGEAQTLLLTRVAKTTSTWRLSALPTAHSRCQGSVRSTL